MNADAWFSLIVASIPVLGTIVAVLVVYTPKWHRSYYLRKLDQMFEADRQWWEEQLRDLGNKRPKE